MDSVTAESGEVFTKQALPVSSEKARGKQKRRVMKSKTTGHKGRKQGTCSSATAIMLGIRNKEDLLKANQKENLGSSTTVGISRNRITQKLSSQKVGIYIKGKASSVVSKGRKTLAELNTHTKLPTQTGEGTGRDIRKALGLNSPACGRPTAQASHRQSAYSSPTEDGASSSVEMECSPRGSSSRLQVQEIAHRLAEGLQPDKVFQGTEYLATIKAELRKVMKQSDPEGYAHLMACLSGDALSPNPPADQPVALPSSPSMDCRASLAQLFGSDSSSAPPNTIPSSNIPVQSIVELAGVDPQQQTCVVAMGTDAQQQVVMPTSPGCCCSHGDVWGGQGALSTSTDLIDILDSIPDAMALAPPTELAPAPKAPSPPSRWLPTPDRPRMFPRKLY